MHFKIELNHGTTINHTDIVPYFCDFLFKNVLEITGCKLLTHKREEIHTHIYNEGKIVSFNIFIFFSL